MRPIDPQPMAISCRSRFRRGARRHPFPFALACAGAVCLLVVVAVAACASGGGGEGGEPFEQGHSPQWFQERHETVLRDFYGYQVRTGQHRKQVVRAREINAGRWWTGERRRLTARENRMARHQSFKQDFFRLQGRVEQIQERQEMVNLRVQQELFAAQARSREELQRKEAEQERVRQQLLRRESLGRQQQAQRRARGRRTLQRATNGRRTGAARGVPGQRTGVAPFTSTQPAAPAPRPAF